jgi:hypothetical protein
MSKQTTKKTPASKKSERLQLVTVLSNLESKQEAFTKAVESLEKFNVECIRDLDLQINTKKEELSTLSDEFDKMKKNYEIETDQYLLEYKYKGACDILKEHGEEPISMHKLKNMKSELEELMKDRAEEIFIGV